MLTPQITPIKVGNYKHYNDRFMVQNANKPYQPKTMGQSFTQPRAPKIVIINNRESNIWYHLFWRSLTNFIFANRAQGMPAPFTQRRQNQNEQAGMFGAFFYFAVLLFGAGVALAYGFVESKKITEDLLAGRKRLTNAIRLFWGAFLGFAGSAIGVQLGAYYGAALGIPVFGAMISGVLWGLLTISLGMLAGKYAAKAFNYIASGFKSTNSDPYSLRPSVAIAIDKQFSTPYLHGSRPNLMLGYILNKIMIAKQGKANPDWIKTLEGYRQDLKQGIYRKELQEYFDSEWALVRNDWYLEKLIPSPTDPRFNHTKLTEIEYDLNALAVITSNIATLTNDQMNVEQQLQQPHGIQPMPYYMASTPTFQTQQSPSTSPLYQTPAMPTPSTHFTSMTTPPRFNASPISPQQPSNLYPTLHTSVPSAPPIEEEPIPTYFPSAQNINRVNKENTPSLSVDSTQNQSNSPLPPPYYKSLN